MWQNPKDDFNNKMSEKIFTDTRYFVIYTAFAAILIFLLQENVIMIAIIIILFYVICI